ncbi:MAG: NUDIX hydrolase [Spirochaetales bacterium]|nr:NUDIX hydrolase [Spirochaetales bacterium]
MCLLKEFEEFIKSPNAFSKNNPVGHITGSCWILNSKMDCVLLTHHRKLNIWIPPGGHSEGETNPLSIAIREGFEETGLKLQLLDSQPFSKDIHIIPKYKETLAHKHFDFTFLFYTINNHNFTISTESHDLKWIPLNDVEKFCNEKNVIYMRDKTLNLINNGIISILNK